MRRSGERRPRRSESRSLSRGGECQRHSERDTGARGARRARANLQDLTVTGPFTGTVLTRTAETRRSHTGRNTNRHTARFNEGVSSWVHSRRSIGRVKIGQAARIYLDSQPDRPIVAYVLRIDPRATFTPENTYFQDDRVTVWA